MYYVVALPDWMYLGDFEDTSNRSYNWENLYLLLSGNRKPSEKDGKFGTVLVDSIFNTLHALELGNASHDLLPHENFSTRNEKQILFNNLCMTQL